MDIRGDDQYFNQREAMGSRAAVGTSHAKLLVSSTTRHVRHAMFELTPEDSVRQHQLEDDFQSAVNKQVIERN